MSGALRTLDVSEWLRIAMSPQTKVAIKQISNPAKVNALREALLSDESFG
jgi:hypothetical protein